MVEQNDYSKENEREQRTKHITRNNQSNIRNLD
jgi:hypothetical protein